MKNLTLSDLARAVWRRRIWFLVPLVLGIAGSGGGPAGAAPTYRAVTTVLVEPQKVPADYVKPTVTTSIEERLRTIEPQIKNRDNMERIIREMDLYPELRAEGLDGPGCSTEVRDDLTVRLQGNTFFIYFVGARSGEGRPAPPTGWPSCSSTATSGCARTRRRAPPRSWRARWRRRSNAWSSRRARSPSSSA